MFVYTSESRSIELTRHYILKPGATVADLCDLLSIPRISAPKLSLARRTDLHKSVYSYLEKATV